jgi:anti-anti-sigma factor
MVYHAKNGNMQFDVEVLDCSNRLDATTMVKLKQRLNQFVKRNHKNVLIDLSKTKHVDLAGLGILIERLRSFRALNGDIKLCNLNRQVFDTFRLVGVSKLIETYESREEALRSFCCPQ